MKVVPIKEAHRKELMQLKNARDECNEAIANLRKRDSDIQQATSKLIDALRAEYLPETTNPQCGFVYLSEDCMYLVLPS